MEQKKLLLIAISVGLFFVIIIGTALVFLKPAGNQNSNGLPSVSGNFPETGTFYRAGEYTQDKPVIEIENEQISSGEDSQIVEPEQIVSVPENNYSYSGDSSTIIMIDPKPAAGVPNVPAAGRAAVSAPPRQAEEQRPAAAQTSGTTAQTSAPVRAANQVSTGTGSGTRTQTPAQSQTPASRTRDDYWVQTGAFTALSGAENVKQTLADKGITSIIENGSVGGTLFFRVRIGPYTSQNEADYWLSLIKSINGFENSQIRKTQTAL